MHQLFMIRMIHNHINACVSTNSIFSMVTTFSKDAAEAHAVGNANIDILSPVLKLMSNLSMPATLLVEHTNNVASTWHYISNVVYVGLVYQ